MNPRIRISRLLVLVCYAAVLISATILAARPVQVRSNNPAAQDVEPPPAQTRGHKKRVLPPYGFSEATPPGKWDAIADFDVPQTNDPDVPVVIVGLASYGGKGAWEKQLMVDDVTLLNRGPNLVKSVKLGWIILTETDRNAGKNRRAALNEGFTIDYPIAILPERVGKVKDLNIDFVKESKGVIQSGRLNETGFIRLRVVAVEFANGSVWREGDVARRHHPARPLPPPQSGCADVVCFFRNNGQGYCTSTSPGTYCKRENCSPNDPAACFCNVYSCTNCVDNDHDGYTNCEGDCNDGDARISPGEFEFIPIGNCSDGIDNDCDPDTPKDCADWICLNTAQACGAPPPCETQNCCEGFQECCTWDSVNCTCNCSPIVIDVLGNGFNLTGGNNGVRFDLNSDGVAGTIAWTTSNSDDAFLALDRNGNGTIDNGTELFGNYAAQPEPPAGIAKNGFLALAEFDKPANGGNNDGVIEATDTVFSSLRLWIDKNHNGVSEPNELHTLSAMGLKTLELDYKMSKKTDEHGNMFKYRAKVKDMQGSQISRWAWDVSLVR